MIDIKELRNDAKTAHYGHLPLEVSGSEMLELLDRLEAAEKNNSAWLYANAPGGWIDNLRIENEALRAKIAEMERQEPAWFIDERGVPQKYDKNKAEVYKCDGLDLLYALPGAQGEEK